MNRYFWEISGRMAIGISAIVSLFAVSKADWWQTIILIAIVFYFLVNWVSIPYFDYKKEKVKE